MDGRKGSCLQFFTQIYIYKYKKESDWTIKGNKNNPIFWQNGLVKITEKAKLDK